MGPFEYLAVFVSIILGLGVTQIITGVAHFIHTGNKVKIYWPHLLMIIIVFLFHLQEWWVFYDNAKIPDWKMSTFLFVLLYPISLFIQARLLFPFDNFEEETDLRVFYYENYRYYFSLIAIQAILSIIDNMWLRGMQLQEQIVQMVLICLTLTISLGKIKNEWVHKVLMIILMVFVVLIFIVSDEASTLKLPTSK